MDSSLKDEILKSIALTGEVEKPSFNPIISSPQNNALEILNLSKGLPKIKPRLVEEFKLIISQPLALQPFNPFEIRCVLCGSIIKYPAWYWNQKLAVNWFHYFVCFDNHSIDRVTARCYRR